MVASGVTIAAPALPLYARSKTGLGASLTLGYDIRRRFALFTWLDVANQGSDAEEIDGEMGLVRLDVGGRVYLGPPAARLAPFLVGTVGVQALVWGSTEVGLSTTTRAAGIAAGIGAGLGYRVNHWLGINAEFLESHGRFDHVQRSDGTPRESPVDIGSSRTYRFKIGFEVRPH